MTNPICCSRKITEFRFINICSKEWPISNMSFKYIIILTFTLYKIVIGTFNNFVNIYDAGPKPKQRQRNSYKLPDQRKRTNCLECFPRELKNMHLLILACLCNPFFATCISDFASLPF